MGILFFEMPRIPFFSCDTNPPDLMRRKLKIKKLHQLLHHVTPLYMYVFTLSKAFFFLEQFFYIFENILYLTRINLLFNKHMLKLPLYYNISSIPKKKP
jgi:hypothetical protein